MRSRDFQATTTAPFSSRRLAPSVLAALAGVLLAAGCAASPVPEDSGSASVPGTGLAPVPGTTPAPGAVTPGSPAQPGVPTPVAGGAVEGLPASCAGVSARAEAELAPSDIIWAIDTSGSMVSSFPAIRDALELFSTKVTDAGIDANIVLLSGANLCVPAPLGVGDGSGTCPPDPLGDVVAGPPSEVFSLGLINEAPDTNEANGFFHLDIGFGGDRGIATIVDYHERYAHMLRPEAQKQFVVTEDGGAPIAHEDLRKILEGEAGAACPGGNLFYNTCPVLTPWNPAIPAGRWVMNGVVCQSQEGVCGEGFLNAPTNLLEMIDQTGGISADLGEAEGNPDPANSPFSELLDKLAEQVIIGAKVGCEYEIPPPPAGEALDPNLVNVVYTNPNTSVTFPRVSDASGCADAMGWSYDDANAPTYVNLCPAACNVVQGDVEAAVDVLFGCETVLY